MIKIGNDVKDIKFGNKQVLKVYRGVDVVWEKDTGTLVYSNSGSSFYNISVNGWSDVKSNKNYKFVSDKTDGEYVIIVNSSFNPIKNNDIFTITKTCNIKIRDVNSINYDIKIYEVKEKANIIM